MQRRDRTGCGSCLGMLVLLIVGQCVAIFLGGGAGSGIYYLLRDFIGEAAAIVVGAIVGLPIWYWISYQFHKLSKRFTRIGFDEIPHVPIPDIPDFPDLP